MSDHKKKYEGGVQDKVNLNERLDEVLKLIEETRLLAAETLYNSLISYLSAVDSSSEDCVALKQRLVAEKPQIDQMLERVALAREALASSTDIDDDSDWIYGVTLFGVTTHYKVQEDNSLLLRLQGSREDLPLFEQLAVVHEVDLYPTWVPFCSHADTLTKLGHADLIAHFEIQIAMMSREVAARFCGVDCLTETGSVVLLGRSIEEWEDPVIPWKPTGWLHDRMILKDLKALIEVESPNHAKVIIIASIDPRAHLPPFLVNLILQKLAGVILYLLQCQAEKVVAHPEGEHGKRILSDKEFYSGWLLPKLRRHCANKGWDQPVIRALGADGIPASVVSESDGCPENAS
eukprot:CAMPEP_0182437448 /NCGR_PEP_ID=MMETSP1167-20130531/85057_1 /TAXON_ID=2988 /ORGANISM="Mallomonas Sp, Strain CCMP3275" /LENGTH=347 /DNA_ID=CAMNT_0024630377 /DNA_START=618 /DNA_END=1661 /DNA_ORIENTATION=-